MAWPPPAAAATSTGYRASDRSPAQATCGSVRAANSAPRPAPYYWFVNLADLLRVYQLYRHNNLVGVRCDSIIISEKLASTSILDWITIN
jgi:hypothetical protein